MLSTIYEIKINGRQLNLDGGNRYVVRMRPAAKEAKEAKEAKVKESPRQVLPTLLLDIRPWQTQKEQQSIQKARRQL